MAISHTNHDHPNTPTARAACRKAMASRPDASPALGKPIEPAVLIGKSQGGPKIVNIEMKGRGSSRWNTKPKVATNRLKVSGTLIKAIGDLADVPAAFGDPIRDAWKRGWTVQVGAQFNEAERRVVITAPLGEVALVWSEDGRTGVFLRPRWTSVTKRAESWMAAFDAAA